MRNPRSNPRNWRSPMQRRPPFLNRTGSRPQTPRNMAWVPRAAQGNNLPDRVDATIPLTPNHPNTQARSQIRSRTHRFQPESNHQPNREGRENPPIMDMAGNPLVDEKWDFIKALIAEPAIRPERKIRLWRTAMIQLHDLIRDVPYWSNEKKTKVGILANTLSMFTAWDLINQFFAIKIVLNFQHYETQRMMDELYGQVGPEIDSMEYELLFGNSRNSANNSPVTTSSIHH